MNANDVTVLSASPTLLGGYDTPGRAQNVAIVGNRAYVADYSSGVDLLSGATTSPSLSGDSSLATSSDTPIDLLLAEAMDFDALTGPIQA